MKLKPNLNQLTKAAIQESVEKIDTGLMCAPMTCVYIVLGKLTMSRMLGIIDEKDTLDIYSRLADLLDLKALKKEMKGSNYENQRSRSIIRT